MQFWGNPRAVVSAIDTSGGITALRSSGSTPFFMHVSASAVTATGTDRPYEDLEYRWDFGDPTGTEVFTDPRGIKRNANIQYGPEGVYCYRSAGSYTVTLRARGLDSDGTYVTETKTLDVTVSDFDASGGEYYFDSIDGDDDNDGLSSSTPKKSISALNGLIASNTSFLLKKGSHWLGTVAIHLGFSSPDCAGVRFDAYGSGAKPIVEVNSGAEKAAFVVKNGGASTAVSVSDLVVSNVKAVSSIINPALAVQNTFNTSGDGTLDYIYFDNCAFEVTAEGNTNTINVDADSGFGLWNCTVDNPQQPDLGNRIGFLGGPNEWGFIVGGAFKGGGSSVLLDHHIYPHVRYHSMYRWINFGYGEHRNYCINTNYNQAGATLEYAEYHYIGENYMSGTLRAHDASNGDNDPSESRFRNFVSERNIMDGLGGDGLVLFFGAETITERYNKVFGCNGGRFFAPDQTMASICKSNVYGNLIYRVSGAGAALVNYNGTWTVAQQVTDNVVVDERATAKILDLVASDHVSAGSTIDNNQYYAPNDTTPFIDDGTAKSFASWQSTGMDANSTDADPDWIDAGNGLFDLPAKGVSMLIDLE